MIEYYGNRRKLVCDTCGKYIWFDSNRECMDFIHDNDDGWTFEKYDNGGSENWCDECSD